MVKGNKSQFFVKRLAVVAVAFAMLFAVFIGTGCAGWHNYEFNENDFKLTIEIDKTEARVGDTLAVVITFVNLSNKRLRARGLDATIGTVEELLNVTVTPYGENVLFVPRRPSGCARARNFTISSDFIMTKTTHVYIEKIPQFLEAPNIRQIHGHAVFILGDNLFIIYAEPKIIYIEEN